MSSDTQKINAVFEGDLKKVLNDLGIYQAIVNGEIKCVSCSNIITLDNLEYIYSKEGKIVISCNLPECREKINEHSNDAV